MKEFVYDENFKQGIILSTQHHIISEWNDTKRYIEIWMAFWEFTKKSFADQI